MSQASDTSKQTLQSSRKAFIQPFKSRQLPQSRTIPAQRTPLQAVNRPPSSPRDAHTFGKAPLIFLAFGVVVLSGYGTFLYSSYKREATKANDHHVPADVSDRYEKTAEHFDKDVDTMEWFMGMGRLRRRLVEHVKGDVLEVSVGTARNLPYYPLARCTSITMVDQSPKMVEIAMKKWKNLRGHESVNAYFRRQSAVDPIKSPSTDGFDTVVQTMGLCSTPEPERLLQNLGNMTKQEGGRILLLEHGRSHYRWLNNILDNLAPAHADKHGCWWNKDIAAIVERSGLEVVNMKRHHLGTTWWVELKPKKKPVLETETASGDGRIEAGVKRWWSLT